MRQIRVVAMDMKWQDGYHYPVTPRTLGTRTHVSVKIEGISNIYLVYSLVKPIGDADEGT